MQFSSIKKKRDEEFTSVFLIEFMNFCEHLFFSVIKSFNV